MYTIATDISETAKKTLFKTNQMLTDYTLKTMLGLEEAAFNQLQS